MMKSCMEWLVRTGSETAFSSLYTHLVKPGECSLEQLIDWLTVQPAKLFNLTQAGMLRIGDAADIAVFDLYHPFKFSEAESHSGNQRN